MALLVREISPKKAEKLGIAYERGNYKLYRKGGLEEGSLPDQASSQMDLRNNAVGIEMGKALKAQSVQELVGAMIAGIVGGKMTVIYKDLQGRSLSCDGEILADGDWQGKWENRRCLVASDRKKP
jgi:hypothetical protein